MERLDVRLLIIRADASTQIGTGHLMRCLALGQAWQDAGGNVVFITACQQDGLLQRLNDEGFNLCQISQPYPHSSDWDKVRSILALSPDSWVVLDGYHFDEIYQKQIKAIGNRLLVIDDIAHLKRYYADIVLNQNLHAEQLPYSCEPYTRLLLGTHYVLLRREFLVWKDHKRETPEMARKVLVTLGGSDPNNVTLRVIQALQTVDIPDLEAIIVIGASNHHAIPLETAAKQSRASVRIVYDVKNMPELMAWADVAISAGGSTAWELAFMGVPAIFLVLADNQRPITESLSAAGAALNLGWYSETTSASISERLMPFLMKKKVRAKMAQQLQKLVDGDGTNRIILNLKEEKLRVRRVREQDCKLLWEWANDPETRANSFDQELIPWADHVIWFGEKMANPGCYHYILLNEQALPIGQIRFDILGDEAEVSVSIAPGFRGRGYGTEGIRVASKRLLQETPTTRIYAYIKPNNNTSIRAFTEAGYKNTETKVTRRGHKSMRMIFNRSKEASQV